MEKERKRREMINEVKKWMDQWAMNECGSKREIAFEYGNHILSKWKKKSI